MGAGADDTGRAALALAREAVERFVQTGAIADPPPDLPPGLLEPSAVFVTLRAQRRLRGCIGTITPGPADLAHEIIACAVAAATRDPRFPPVIARELPDLAYEVAIVGALEPAPSPGNLDPKTYGVLVEGDGRRGVLLPDLDGVETVEQQLAIARQKAGLSPGAPVVVSRFQVRRYVEGA